MPECAGFLGVLVQESRLDHEHVGITALIEERLQAANIRDDDNFRAGDIRAKAAKGLKVLGVCNGFQIVTEAGLLPGALVRNADLHFVCREVKLAVENNSTFFTNRMEKGAVVSCPVAHGEGNYICDEETLKALEGGGRIVFRYAQGTNPNGAMNDIAGIVNKAGNVIGMMPHPENMIEPLHGKTDCRPLFESLLAA